MTTQKKIDINYARIKSIEILNFKNSNVIESKIKILLTNEDVIKLIVKDYINQNKKEPVKFVPAYNIVIRYVDTSKEIYYVRGHIIEYQGRTYKLTKNLEQFITNNLVTKS